MSEFERRMEELFAQRAGSHVQPWTMTLRIRLELQFSHSAVRRLLFLLNLCLVLSLHVEQWYTS